ncbi:unnamed protein product [Camellia sinensis]
MIEHTNLQQALLQACVCLLSSAPMIVDLNTGTTTVLPVSLPETVTVRNKLSDGSACCTPTSACFNNYEDLVYVGNSKGEILVIDHKMLREGQYLLKNSNDRTIRIYENLLPLKDVFKAIDELSNIPDELDDVEKLKAVGAMCLALFREFQDSITKIHWKAPCFSGDGEWVVGGSANKGEHKIHIWDRAGCLVKILEAPKEALIDSTWHPVHSIVVSVLLTGLGYIWAKDYIENCSAFATDFKELEENEDVEREDEFDLMLVTEKVKESDVDEDNEVDIMTVEKDSAFSDSDMSQEEICFLAANLCHDVPVQQDKCIESSSKLVDSNHSGSPLYVEAGRNGHSPDHASSPSKGMDNCAAEDTKDDIETNKNMCKMKDIKLLVVVFGIAVVQLGVYGKEYVVGDEGGWSYDVDYYAWLSNKTFYVGDVLVFNYSKDVHNVIIVNSTGYDQCIASPNLGELHSGHDRVTLESPPGNKYYICQWHCDYSDQKLNVTVFPSPLPTKNMMKKKKKTKIDRPLFSDFFNFCSKSNSLPPLECETKNSLFGFIHFSSK